MTAHVLHPSVPQPKHDGPGHRFGDPGYCGGCWWEQIGRYEERGPWPRHAENCPACAEAAS